MKEQPAFNPMNRPEMVARDTHFESDYVWLPKAPIHISKTLARQMHWEVDHALPWTAGKPKEPDQVDDEG